MVLCLVGGGPFSPDEPELHPPIASGVFGETGDPVELGRGVRIDRISEADASLVVNACLPRGHYFKPVFPFGQRYSFVSDVPPEECEAHPFRWDPDRVIWDALVLSRLVHNNGHSVEFAARITDYDNGEQRVVYTLDAEGRNVYMLREGRDWLDAEEGQQLRTLLATYWEDRPAAASRLGRAMWRMEYACWVPYADLVLPILVSGLEALLKTERRKATRQFTERVPTFADELGVDGIDGAFCEQMYEARSDWVHGDRVRLFPTVTEQLEQRLEDRPPVPPTEEELTRLSYVARLQDVLRAGVRRCIEEPEFRAIFDDTARIRARWPIS